MNYTVDFSREATFSSLKLHIPVAPIQASVAKIETLWQKMYMCYIGPGGAGQKADKYFRAKSWIQTSEEVWMPLLKIKDYAPDRFKFNDGRHTFAALRDLGFKTITVGVPSDSVAIAVALIGSDASTQ